MSCCSRIMWFSDSWRGQRQHFCWSCSWIKGYSKHFIFEVKALQSPMLICLYTMRPSLAKTPPPFRTGSFRYYAHRDLTYLYTISMIILTESVQISANRHQSNWYGCSLGANGNKRLESISTLNVNKVDDGDGLQSLWSFDVARLTWDRGSKWSTALVNR